MTKVINAQKSVFTMCERVYLYSIIFDIVTVCSNVILINNKTNIPRDAIFDVNEREIIIEFNESEKLGAEWIKAVIVACIY